MKDVFELEQQLQTPDKTGRLAALQTLTDAGVVRKQTSRFYYVNNHIHTCYSFSPYTPTMAVWQSYQAGLLTAGIMDHDTLAGALEFRAAGKILGLATTLGIECRADFSATPLAGRRINHPDQDSLAYVALHGIAEAGIARVQAYFAPYREIRSARNAAMVTRLNEILAPCGLNLDYVQDVLPLSCHGEGGTVTERHLLMALALKILEAAAPGEAALRFVEGPLGLSLDLRQRAQLEEGASPFYAYDLLGVLKSALVERFYIKAGAECPAVDEVLALAEEVEAISAYAYLGDVEQSVTGDKKPQRFEDSYLPELFKVLKVLGFRAVTYMPTRNTPQQLVRIREFCRQQNLLEICGEDINSPRQAFICETLAQPQFAPLIDAAWALIGHEKSVNRAPHEGIFSQPQLPGRSGLVEKIAFFKRMGIENAELRMQN